MNEINELMKEMSNVHKVKEIACELEEALTKFEMSHEMYHAHLIDEDDMQESESNCEVERRRACDCREKN